MKKVWDISQPVDLWGYYYAHMEYLHTVIKQVASKPVYVLYDAGGCHNLPAGQHDDFCSCDMDEL